MGLKESLEGKIPLLGMTYFQLLMALITLLVGILVIKLIVAIFKRSLKKTKVPPLMANFLGKFLSAILYVVLFVIILGTVGVEVGPIFLGLSAALGLIIAFGMQDSLNNMFAGIWIATLRPIRMDEWVEIAGHWGRVSGLNIMSTELLTPDYTYITIPNKEVWGSPIKNDTRMPRRRVNVDVGVAYGTDLDKAIKIAMGVLKKHEMVMEDPAPDVVVTELGDSAIVLQLRAWTKTENYWTLKGWLNRNMPGIYSKRGIEIPFPQMDVHMKKQ